MAGVPTGTAGDFGVGQGNQFYQEAAYDRGSSQALATAGLQQQRLSDVYNNRTAPDYRDSQGAAGNLYSGGMQEGVSRLTNDFQYDEDSIQNTMKTTMANLGANRLNSMLGAGN